MGCLLFSGFFWGTFLILLGIVIILKVLFHIDIPLFRIFFAVLLIYFGIRLLLGGGWCRPWHAVPFPETTVSAAGAGGNEYHVLFGRGVIDLTGVPVDQGTVRKKIDTVFGSSVVKIDPSMPVLITVHSAFAGARMPDGNVISFGQYTYRSPAYKDGANALIADASVVFGELSIVAAAKQ